MTHRPDETPLGSRILEYLVARGPSKAIEIAKALGVDKTAVNQVLYGQMKGQVVQDSSYRWSPVSRPSSNPPATKAPPDRDGAPPAGPVHLPSPGPRATAPPALGGRRRGQRLRRQRLRQARLLRASRTSLGRARPR